MTSDSNDPKPAPEEQSKAETTKLNSRCLRGTISESLAADTTHFGADDTQLLKFHGVYQQQDRDSRRERNKAGQEPDYSFMVRVALPGGALTAGQYLTLDRIAEEYAGGSLRITSRQGMQLHCVRKPNLKATIAAINHELMTTISACGDVERNVMAPPAPMADEAYVLVQKLARRIAEELRPATRAYHEIWLDGEKVTSSEEKEPLYDEQYLPRKFKTGVAVAGDNSIDVYSYDCGLVAIVENDEVRGFNLLVGGGMGMTHNREDTFAALAQPLGFIAPEHAVEAVRAVIAIFRDHGNRADRKHARLKYLIADWGMDRFREEFRRRVSFGLADSVETPRPGYHDFLGKHPQNDGRWSYGVFVQNGRVVDRDGEHIKTALRKIVAQHQPGVRLTASQNLLLTDLDEGDVAAVEDALREDGVTPGPELSNVRRYSMACPALPTCGLALTESERAMPEVLALFEEEFETLGLEDEPISLRMTGCPNGCARPYTADIGLVGRKPGREYNIYVGGGLSGDRLADLYAEDVPLEQLCTTLRPLLARFAGERRAEEGFSDFYQRLMDRPSRRQRLTGKESASRAQIELKVLS